jgi:hypothetical protein
LTLFLDTILPDVLFKNGLGFSNIVLKISLTFIGESEFSLNVLGTNLYSILGGGHTLALVVLITSNNPTKYINILNNFIFIFTDKIIL